MLYTGDDVFQGGGDMNDRAQTGRERLLTPGEVSALFRVDPKTVTRWAAAGRIGSIRTPGGHRRFRESEVRALLAGDALGAVDASAADTSIPEQPGASEHAVPRP